MHKIGGINVGFLKLLFHRDTKQLLGIHCFGERSSEIVHIGQAIMEQKGEGNNIEYFVNTTFKLPNNGRSLPSGGNERIKSFVLTSPLL